METKKLRMYKCFSNNLKEYIMSFDIEYITIALDPKTKKQFWMFIKTDELDEILTKWSLNKPSY